MQRQPSRFTLDCVTDSLRMPRRFVRGQGGRLALTVIALACGVALVCAIDLVNRAVLQAFTEVIDTMAGRAALQVSAGESGLFPEDVAATVAAVPGVQLAVPVVSATAFTADDTGELLTVHGVEVTNEAAVRVYEARDAGGLEIADPLVFLTQPDSIVLTRTFAERRHLRVGDAITLETPTGRKPFTIRGLLEPQGVARVYGGNLVVMDLYAAEAAFTRPGFINRVDVVVDQQADTAHVREAVGAILPDGLRVEVPSQRKVDLQRVTQSVQALLRGVGLIGLAAAFLIAFNRLATVFEERIAQLGILRAIGVGSRGVQRELVKESMLLGIAGVTVGVPLGIGLARLLLPVIATTTAVSSKLSTPEAALTPHALSLVTAAILGVGAAILAAAVPARRTSKMVIAETLRHYGTELAPAARPWIWLAFVVAVIVALGATGIEVASRAPEWGMVASGGIIIATALAARPFVHFLLRAVGSEALSDAIGATSRFAIATLLRRPRAPR